MMGGSRLNEIIGYVQIKPSKLSKINLKDCDLISPYGEFGFYKNDEDNYQLQAYGKLILLDKELKHSVCLYKGNMVYGGKIVNISRKPFIKSQSRFRKIKELDDKIDKLQKLKYRLFETGVKL